MATVALVGEGPAAEAVRAALGDADTTVHASVPDDIGGVDLAVAVGPVSSEGFDRAHRTAREAATPWLSVELGGVGGHAIPDLDAAVSGFAPETACFDCLRTRVAVNQGDDANANEDPAAGSDPADARLAGAVAGREATRLLAGAASMLLGGVVELPHARRHVLPVPGCGCGQAPARRVRRGDDDLPLDDALAAAERALDPRVGVIREVGEVESFPAPYYLATLTETTGFSDAAVPRHAAGVATGWDRAFMKSLGEALERYAASMYRVDAFECGPPGTIGSAVPPARFVRPSDRDSDTSDETWIPGHHLATGDDVRLPAEFVVFPPPAERHRPAITTGLGLGTSGAGALLSGLYEVIERDAAMIAWYSSVEPLSLAVDDERYRTLAARATSEDLTATALLLTVDVDVPVVAACVHRDADWPRFAAGMAADLDPEAAAADALEEAVQNFLELRGMGPDDAADEPGAVGHYATFPPAAREFVSPETTVPAASVGPEPPPTGGSELDALLARTDDAGLDAYAARLTTRDLAALGYEAVRVVVPTAQPLFTDEPYFGERARTVPVTLGYEPRLDREHHPFP